MRLAAILSSILADMRFALRQWRASPRFALGVGLVLAIGIGATSAIFGVVKGILLDPLPFEHSDRLVLIWESDIGQRERRLGTISDATFVDVREETRAFEAVSAITNGTKGLTGLTVPINPLVRFVTASYLPLLGVQPLLGRSFHEEEDRPGGPRVVILSHGLWEEQFAGDRSIVGQTIDLDFEPYEVVGVLPAGFKPPIGRDAPQLWLPLALDTASLNRARRGYLAFGKLAEGSSLERARSELANLTQVLSTRHPQTNATRSLEVELVKESLVGTVRPTLWLFLAASLCVLFVGCVNIGTLMLVRMLARRHEIAARVAIGARPWRLVRQILVENLFLAGLAGIVGAFLAFGGIRAAAASSASLQFPRLESVEMDFGVVGFAIAASILAGIGVSLVASRQPLLKGNVPATLLRSGDFMSGRISNRRLQGLLVGVEVAVAVALLVVAFSVWQAFLSLRAYDPGFDPGNVLTLRVGLRGASYEDPSRRVAFFSELEEAISALPGVESVGAASRIPLTSLPIGAVKVSIDGREAEAEDSPAEALVRVATGGFFETLSIRLLSGRTLAEQDAEQAEKVVVVNETFAKRYFGSDSPLGAMIELGDSVKRRIVGMVGDVRLLGNPPRPIPMAYVPYAQDPVPVLSLVIRAQIQPAALTRQVRILIAARDRLLPVYEVETMGRLLGEADQRERLASWLLAALSFISISLALIGLYSIVFSSLEQRNRELAIRLAVGARPNRLLYEAMRSASLIVGAGVVSGLLLTVWLSKAVQAQLQSIGAADAWTVLVCALLVGGTALIAAAAAARRGIPNDPARVLR